MAEDAHTTATFIVRTNVGSACGLFLRRTFAQPDSWASAIFVAELNALKNLASFWEFLLIHICPQRRIARHLP
jgi:hypothetical protein